MRKAIWCCSAAGVMSAAGFLSLAYYACRCPDSLVGRSMQLIAEASLAMQPLDGLTSLAMHSSQANTSVCEAAGAVEECIPDDPQPIAPEPKEPLVIEEVNEIEVEAAPIVIGEEEPTPREEATPFIPGPINFNGPATDQAEIQAPEVPSKGCPIVMPYCQDDGAQLIPPPRMPGAEAGDKPASANSEETGFKEWLKLFDEGKQDKSPTSEELPAPVEDEAPQAELKCQEDSHLHEHYPGCPRVTCPYIGKSYPSRTPPRKSGTEEASEEPPQEEKESHRRKVGKPKEEELPVPNVDTMEYRKSDAGLNEYGPGPLH
jgi:hypothetical protein